MLLMQSYEARKFMGRLDIGTDIINGFQEICLKHKIFCGTITASGYLKSARILNFSVTKKDIISSERIEGPFMVPMITGNISQKENENNFNIFSVLSKIDTRPAEGLPFSAKLIGGEVISCEFVIQSFDDLRLLRGLDNKTGLDEWVYAQYAFESENKKPIIPSLMKQNNIMQYIEEDEESEELGKTIKLGDYIKHPKFGICQIVQIPSDNKIMIKLETNKMVELSFGVLKVTELIEDQEKKIFQVEIKKRS